MSRQRQAALLCLLCWIGTARAQAQSLDFQPPASPDTPEAARAMRDLAARVIPVYQDSDRTRYLANLATLQLVAGDYAAGYAARLSLRELRSRSPGERASTALAYDLYARALALEREMHLEFRQAFTQSFTALATPLSDREAWQLARWLTLPSTPDRDALLRAFDRWRTSRRISAADAISLAWQYLTYRLRASTAPLLPPLLAADDARRYVMEPTISIQQEKRTLTVSLVRPRVAGPLPAILELSPAAAGDAKAAAAHGYVGVLAYPVRTARAGPPTRPFEHAGDEVRSVIAWIGRQPFSDGRVGLYGTGYGGFAAWAALKQPPPALKAVATFSPDAPGVSLPMDGGIFRSADYRWLIERTRPAESSAAGLRSDSTWLSIERKWYSSGKPFRDLDGIAGIASPIFREWLRHPTYDGYWQRLVPNERELGALDLPVLTMSGYYDVAQAAALHYFRRHFRFNPGARHTLLLGPYGRVESSSPDSRTLRYPIDAAALIDLEELRFEWFDHVLKGSGPRPAILKDRVNLEVSGANTWHHAPSLEAIGGEALRLYLEPQSGSGGCQLTRVRPAPGIELELTVNLAERRDGEPRGSDASRDPAGASGAGLDCIGEPLPEPVMLGGSPTVAFDLIINKRDVDIEVRLYEALASGERIELFDPPCQARASLVRNPTRRVLLEPGTTQRLAFTCQRAFGRQLRAGSRLGVTVGVIKRPSEEINYGTGGDVSAESALSGRVPMKIRFIGGSYLDLPAVAARAPEDQRP